MIFIQGMRARKIALLKHLNKNKIIDHSEEFKKEREKATKEAYKLVQETIDYIKEHQEEKLWKFTYDKYDLFNKIGYLNNHIDLKGTIIDSIKEKLNINIWIEFYQEPRNKTQNIIIRQGLR